MISYGRQSINEDDIQAVVDVLRSNYLTQGPVVAKLEQALALTFKARQAVAVSSATAALHCACLALGLKEGDALWTTALSFVASANCGKYCGAAIKLIDVDSTTRNISITDLEGKLKISQVNGTLPKILVVVHFAGIPCDMQAIAKLAQEYGFFVIEDAAHAIGSEYQALPIGSCQYSDAVVFSFHPVKTIAAGEGGALLLNDAALGERVRQFACHGIERNPKQFRNKPSSPCYYEMQLLGFNYRLSDIHAALALSQLQRLPSFIEKRKALVDSYNQALNHCPVKLPSAMGGGRLACESIKVAWHVYVIECKNKIIRDALYDFLVKNNVMPNIHYIPIYRQPFYQDDEKASISNVAKYEIEYPNAELYYAKAITLPLYYDLTTLEQKKVIDLIYVFFKNLANDRTLEVVND